MEEEKRRYCQMLLVNLNDQTCLYVCVSIFQNIASFACIVEHVFEKENINKTFEIEFNVKS